VIPESERILVDTGPIIHICRADHAAVQIDRRYNLRARRKTPLISAVSVGESLAMAKRNAWGPAKVAALRALLAQLVVVGIDQPSVLETYARLDVHLTGMGRRMGQQNDLWIAATAAATGAVLLTTDRDFDPLHPAELRREWVDPASLR
jgi:tRNA(fMet)-specific endonuclease VapC